MAELGKSTMREADKEIAALRQQLAQAGETVRDNEENALAGTRMVMDWLVRSIKSEIDPLPKGDRVKTHIAILIREAIASLPPAAQGEAHEWDCAHFMAKGQPCRCAPAPSAGEPYPLSRVQRAVDAFEDQDRVPCTCVPNSREFLNCKKDCRAVAPASSAGEAVLVPREVVAFLCGEAPLDGVWFGDKYPTKIAGFWWRKYLLAAAPTTGETREPLHFVGDDLIRTTDFVSAPSAGEKVLVPIPLPAWLGEDTPELRAKLSEFVRALAAAPTTGDTAARSETTFPTAREIERDRLAAKSPAPAPSAGEPDFAICLDCITTIGCKRESRCKWPGNIIPTAPTTGMDEQQK